MASAPSTPSSSKRELSSSSTPSSSSSSIQPVKKAKIPSDSTEPDKQNPIDPTTQTIIESVTAALKDTISEQVTTSVKAMAQSVADIISTSLNDRMTAIEADNKYLHEQIDHLSKRVNDLESSSTAGDRRIDAAEQYSRRNCLRISGVKEKKAEVTYDVILQIAEVCGVDLSLSEIDRSHRLQQFTPANPSARKRPRDIIVKFVSYRSRNKFFRGKSHLKNNTSFPSVYINEDLTRLRTNLLKEARLLVKNNVLHCAWSFDGRIYIKKPDGSRRTISSLDDLQAP